MRRGNYHCRVESAWPLIGRAEELAQISRALASTSQYAGVLLVGDAGVGKSRLAKEALTAISGRCDVRWIAASASGAALPLGAFAEWIGDPGADPTVLVHGVIGALTGISCGRPVILGVDDAHHLDDLSAFVVHQLVHRRLAKVIVTLRNHETAPAAITGLWKDAYLQRIDVQPLTRQASDSLIATVLGAPLTADAAERIWSLTHGNALFLRHLVDQELASRRMSRDGGLWSWRDDSTASTTLGELVDAQMGALTDAVGEVVDLLAVGEPLDADLLAGLVDWSAVDEACAKGLVALRHSDEQSIVRLAHPLYGEVRRARVGPARLRRVRGRLVSALSDTPVVDARDLIRRGLLLLDSDQPPDVTLLTSAAGAALQLLDPLRAERLPGAARRIGGDYAATMLHASALHLAGRVTDAEAVFATARLEPLTPQQRSDVASFRAANLYAGIGSVNRATQVINDALDGLPAAAHGAVVGFRAVLMAMDGPSTAAIEAAEAVLASEPTDPPTGIAAMGALLALMTAFGYAGRADAVADVAQRGYGIAQRAPDLSAIVFAFTEQHVQALLLAGHLADAEALAHQWEHQTLDVPIASRGYASLFMGQALLGAGRVNDAREWLEKAMPAFTRFDGEKYGSVICGCDLTVARALAGYPEDAAATLNALEAEHNPYGFLESRCELAAAWVAAAQGATTPATERALHAADLACGQGHFAQEVVCLQTATRFGDATTATRLVELCDRVQGPRVAAAATHASALAARDADLLVAASKQYERIGDILSAADTVAQAAAVYRSNDRRGAALSAQECADRLAQRCGSAKTPALRALKTAPLTARQREILDLASQGLSNKQIAARLNLSVRSVEGHRYRASKKKYSTLFTAPGGEFK